MKVIKQIDAKARLIQTGKAPDVVIALQRKRWWGWHTINTVPTIRYDFIEDFEAALLEDEIRRKQPYYGRIVSREEF